ncbi:MAG: signal peptidase II [Oscillospiraceae bacterium]
MSYMIAIIFSVLILIADQVTKFLVASNFQLGETRPFIDGFMNFTYIHNSGAAFGIFKDQTWVFLAITVLVMIVCIGMLVKKTYSSKLMTWSIFLVLSGGMGNLIDRIFRGGNVVDFLEFDFIRFPIFNIADCAVVVGAGMIIVYFIFDFIKEVQSNKIVEIAADHKPEAEEKQEQDTEEKQ